MDLSFPWLAKIVGVKMKLLVSVASAAQWQSVTSHFAMPVVKEITALATELPDVALLWQPVTTSDIAALLKQFPAVEIVVAYPQSESRVADLLETGSTVTEALTRWQQATELLLQLQQQQRRQLKIFNLHQLTADSSALPEWLAFSSGLQLTDERLLAVIATQAIWQNSQTKALQQRLFVSSLALAAAPEPVFALEVIRQQLIQPAVLEQLKTDYAAVQLQHAELQQQSAAILQEKQQLQLELQATAEQQQQIMVERDLILQQLLTVQEELEQQHLHYATAQDEQQKTQRQLEQSKDDNQKLRQQLQQNQQQLKQQQDKYQQLEQETQPMRLELQQRVPAKIAQLEKTIATAQQQQQQTEQENSALLQQLLIVQEELERYMLLLQAEQQKNNHAITAKDKQFQRDLNKLESQLRSVKARAASAEHHVQLLRQELTAVKGSAAWKTAAPVRVLSRLVHKTDKAKQKLQQETALLLTSEYFDLEWYLETYPDVAHSKLNPAEHYLRFGAAEGRMPGPLFDGNWYLQLYPDVAASNINPLLHFIKFGQQEGRSTSPKLLTDNSQPKEE